MVEHWDDIEAERLALADQLDALAPEQWEVPSLCRGWTVRQVAAHLVAPSELGLPRYSLEILRTFGSLGRANHRIAVESARRPTGDLVAALRRQATARFTPPTLDSRAPLTDVVVHGLDIRVPLDLPVVTPPDRIRPVLDLAMDRRAHFFMTGRLLPRLRYVATDADWSRGTGEEARGPAAPLALTMLGRPALSDLLEGRGAEALRRWVRRA